MPVKQGGNGQPFSLIFFISRQGFFHLTTPCDCTGILTSCWWVYTPRRGKIRWRQCPKQRSANKNICRQTAPWRAIDQRDPEMSKALYRPWALSTDFIGPRTCKSLALDLGASMRWSNHSSVCWKKNASGREYTKPGIWPRRISSMTLKYSTTRARHHSHPGGVSPEDFEQASSWGQNLSTVVGAVHYCSHGGGYSMAGFLNSK